MKTSPKRKCTHENHPLLNYNMSERKPRQRYKTNADDHSRKMVSKSLNLAPKRTLADLQELRNEVKRRKQASAEKRIPTEKQRFRYQEKSE